MKGRKGKVVALPGVAKLGVCPSAPAWLSDHAKAEWKRTAPELHGRRLLAADTMATLEAYCAAVGMVREYQDTLAREGHFTAGEDGPRPHPASRMLLAAMRETRLLAAELGLTPHRRGTRGTEGGKADGWDSDLLA